MNSNKATRHLGQSISMITVFLLASIGIIGLVALQSRAF